MYLKTEAIRSELCKADLNQKELARVTGMSYSMINAICNGRSCRYEVAQKIADALGVNVEEIKR